jgi:hypothetical protein
MWTTVSCLNVNSLDEIKDFAKARNIPHDWAFLSTPDVLNVKYVNPLTKTAKHISPEEIAVSEDNTALLEKFMAYQDKLRGISYSDYLSF